MDPGSGSEREWSAAGPEQDSGPCPGTKLSSDAGNEGGFTHHHRPPAPGCATACVYGWNNPSPEPQNGKCLSRTALNHFQPPSTILRARCGNSASQEMASKGAQAPIPAPKQALTKMSELLCVTPVDRAGLAKLFETAARANLEVACQSYTQAIDALMRNGVSAITEVLAVYRALHKKDAANTFTLADVVKDVSLDTCVARTLRCQACHMLRYDLEATLPFAALAKLARPTEAGRLAAVDFLLSRKTPSVEDAQWAVRLVRPLRDQNMVADNPLRYGLLARLLQITNTVESLGPQLRPAIQEKITGLSDVRGLGDLLTAKSIKSNTHFLQGLAPAQITVWLSMLRESMFGPEAIRIKDTHSQVLISNMLVNIMRKFQSDPVALDMLELALDIEFLPSTPSRFCIDKVVRAAVSVAKFGGPAQKLLARGLKLLLWWIDPEAASEEAKLIIKRLAPAIAQIKDITPLVDSVISIDNETTRPMAAKLLVILLTSVDLNISSFTLNLAERRKQVDRAMAIALRGEALSSKEKLKLHQCYVLLFNQCYSVAELETYIGCDTGDTPDICTIQALATLAYGAPDCQKALQYCEHIVQIVKGSREALPGSELEAIEVVPMVLQKHAFVHVAEQIGIPLLLHESQIPEEVLPADMDETMAVAFNGMHPLDSLGSMYRAFRVLRRIGSHFEAYAALRALLHRARPYTGPLGVRYQAYLRAIKIYLAEEMQASTNYIRIIVTLKYGDELQLGEELDKVVNQIVASLLARSTSPKMLTNLELFERENKSYREALSNDPVLEISTEAVLAVPALVTCRSKSVRAPRDAGVQEHISRLLSLYHDLATDPVGMDWLDELRVSEAMVSLSCAATALRSPPSVLKRLDPHAAEKTQGKLLQLMRAFYSYNALKQGQTEYPPSILASEIEDDSIAMPRDIVCLSLDFDSDDTLVLTRREHGEQPVTLRLPEKRATSLANHSKAAVSYSQARAGIIKIIDEGRQYTTTEDSPSEREKFWQKEIARDKRLGILIHSMERSWIGGFGTFLSPFPGALHAQPELLKCIDTLLHRQVPQLAGKAVEISEALAACIRDAALSGSLSKLEDVLYALFDNLALQGVRLASDELTSKELMGELLRQMRQFAVPNKKPKNLILICSRKANMIPWETFHSLRDYVVTRAFTLGQLKEWIELRHQKRASAKDKSNACVAEQRKLKVATVLNPHANLSETQQEFEADFRLRGWEGFTGVAPTCNEYVKAFTTSTSLLYLGHGSTSFIAQPMAIRRQFKTQTGVYLFGCSSAAIKYPLFNNDMITSYAVAGSQELLGALWRIKDKDCNRFTKEFLSRVFDANEGAGEALREARKACYSPFITGAAWVLYGLP